MPNRNTRAAPAVVLIAVVAACGRGDGATPASQAAQTLEFCRASVSAYLSRAEACTNLPAAAADVAAPALDPECADLSAAVGRGRIRFDAAAAADCLAAARAQPCATFDDAEPARSCDAAFAGTVALGSGCQVDEECDGGYCAMQAGPSCGGTCAPRIHPGGGCASDGECAVGSACWFGVCVEGSAGAEGQPCGSEDWCQAGLACDRATGLCAPRRTSGPCRMAHDCATGSTCTSNGMTDGTCIPVVAIGEACGPDRACPDGAWCGSGVCALLPRVGEPCSSTLRCLGGWCDGSTCAAPLADGVRCVDDGQCGPISTCLGTCARSVCF